MTTEELKALPKVELHCHLDGSLSREFIESRLGRAVQPEELSVSDDCTSLAEYLEKFSLPGQCIMDEKGLEGAGYDVLKSMSQENVCYAEIRFAPLLSETESMNCRSVIEALLKGLERGKKDFGVDFEKTHEKKLRRLVQLGLIQLEGGFLRLTERGMELQNAVVVELMDDQP